MLENISNRSLHLSLKKKKTIGKEIVDKTEHKMLSLSRTNPYINDFHFKEAGKILFEVSVVASPVTEKVESNFLSVITFGVLGKE